LQSTFASKALIVFEPGPPIASVNDPTVEARGWQYVLFKPSPSLPEEITAYFGLTLPMNAAPDDVSLPWCPTWSVAAPRGSRSASSSTSASSTKSADEEQ
jgi:hypothetical protein